MKKAKVFYGEPETGKTRKAMEIAQGRNFVYLDGRSKKAIENRFYFSRVNSNTDLIIIDELPNGFNFEYFYGFVSSDRFYYEVNRKGCQSIPTPEFIFITNEKPKFTGRSFDLRFELVEFTK